MITIYNKFWDSVDKKGENECWEWTRARASNGYGSVWDGSKSQLAHRVAWVLTNGIIEDGMFVCHTCDNRGCVNPDHLFLGTNTDNMRDCVAKGRNFVPRGELAKNSKLTDQKVLEIRSLWAAKSGIKQTELAKIHNVKSSVISRVVNNKCWRHV